MLILIETILFDDVKTINWLFKLLKLLHSFIIKNNHPISLELFALIFH